MRPIELGVVMPIYNEEAAIAPVLEEWLLALRREKISFVLLALNDGSTDGTGAVLQQLAAKEPELRIVSKSNTGHGRTCWLGYQMTLENRCHWILQVDGDGQCDPSFFPEFWQRRNHSSLVFGKRIKRYDGMARTFISHVLRLVISLTAGCWIRDANVPYRLIRSDLLRDALPQIPAKAFFTNVLLSHQLHLHHRIAWLPIHFKQRKGGASTLRLSSLFPLAGRLVSELLAARNLSGTFPQSSQSTPLARVI